MRARRQPLVKPNLEKWRSDPDEEATAEHRETATLIKDSLKPKRFPDFHHDLGSTFRYDPSNNDAEYGGSLAIN